VRRFQVARLLLVEKRRPLGRPEPVGIYGGDGRNGFGAQADQKGVKLDGQSRRSFGAELRGLARLGVNKQGGNS